MNEKLKIIVDDKGKTTVWMNGKIVTGIRRVRFDFEVDSFPTHEIEFVTQVAGLEEK